MIKAILWDNDGVLIDTEELFFRATREALRTAGLELDLKLYIEYSLQRGRSCFELLPPAQWPPARVAELRAQRDRIYTAMLAEGPGPIAGVEQALAALRGHYRMAVVTTSRRVHFEAMHRRSGLAGFFEFVLTREDYRQSKPNPEPYLTALRRLGLPADQCVVVEDSERGLAAACAAGLRCIAIPSTLTRGGEFKQAAAVLDRVSMLPSALDSLSVAPASVGSAGRPRN